MKAQAEKRGRAAISAEWQNDVDHQRAEPADTLAGLCHKTDPARAANPVQRF